MRKTARLSRALAIGAVLQMAGAASAQQDQPLPVPGPFQAIAQPVPLTAPQPVVGVLPNLGNIPALPYWMQTRPRVTATPLGAIAPTIFPNAAPQFAPATTRSQGVLNSQSGLAVSGGAGAQFQGGGNYANNAGGNGWGGNRPGFGFAPAPGYFPGYAPGYVPGNGAAPVAPARGYGPNTPAPVYGNAPWGASGFNPFNGAFNGPWGATPFNGPWGGYGYPQQFPRQYPQQFPQQLPQQYQQPYQPQR